MAGGWRLEGKVRLRKCVSAGQRGANFLDRLGELARREVVVEQGRVLVGDRGDDVLVGIGVGIALAVPAAREGQGDAATHHHLGGLVEDGVIRAPEDLGQAVHVNTIRDKSRAESENLGFGVERRWL